MRKEVCGTGKSMRKGKGKSRPYNTEWGRNFGTGKDMKLKDLYYK